MNSDERLDFLRQVGSIQDLQDTDLVALAPRVERVRFMRGTTLTREGEVSERIFQLRSGIIEVGSSGESVYLTGGEILGDRGLRTGSGEATSAVAYTDVEVLALPRSAYEEYLRDRPTVSLALLKALGARIEQSTAPGPAEPRTGARVFPISSLESKTGRTTLGLNLAAAMAELTGGKVLLMDLNLSNDGLVKALGISSHADYADALLENSTLDVGRATWRTKGGFLTVLPPRKKGAKLREGHLLAAFHALVEAFDHVIVDSTCVMAAVNRAVLRYAEKILLVGSPGGSHGVDWDRFGKTVLAPNEIKASKVVCAVNATQPGVPCEPDQRWTVVPHVPELLARCRAGRDLAVLAEPDGAFAGSVRELARRLIFDHRVRILVPDPGTSPPAAAREAVSRLASHLQDRFKQVSLSAPPGSRRATEPAGVTVWTTQAKLTRCLGELVTYLSGLKTELSIPYVDLEIDGRKNLV